MSTAIASNRQSLLAKQDALIDLANRYQQVAVAVSGGIDSMMLVYILHKYSDAYIHAMHATSPAVPQSALNRVKHYAEKFSWHLTVIDAGEFDDANYVSNPINRCYYCKSNLYARIADYLPDTADAIYSGTNCDDLSDYRPGLKAASEGNVEHPYVEAQVVKSEIYQLARLHNLDDLSSLPAQPCLASRVETGIKVKPDDLAFVDEMEVYTRRLFPDIENIRCRITLYGVFIEMSALPVGKTLMEFSNAASNLCAGRDFVFSGVRKYQKGAAFKVRDAV